MSFYFKSTSTYLFHKKALETYISKIIHLDINVINFYFSFSRVNPSEEFDSRDSVELECFPLTRRWPCLQTLKVKRGAANFDEEVSWVNGKLKMDWFFKFDPMRGILSHKSSLLIGVLSKMLNHLSKQAIKSFL